MKKSKIILTSIAFMFAIGGVFASKYAAPESGYFFDNSQPTGSKCVSPKQCQLDNTTTPLCKIQVGESQIQLYRIDGTDNCQTTALHEIQ